MSAQVAFTASAVLICIIMVVAMAGYLKASWECLPKSTEARWIVVLKRYFVALAVSAIPSVLFGVYWVLAVLCLKNTDSVVYVLLATSLASFVLAIVAVFRTESSLKRRVIMLVLMPTAYVFPFIVGLLLFVASLPWENFIL